LVFSRIADHSDISVTVLGLMIGRVENAVTFASQTSLSHATHLSRSISYLIDGLID